MDSYIKPRSEKILSFGKAQLLWCHKSKIVVLANGSHKGDNFEGMIVVSNNSGLKVGWFSKFFKKSEFVLFIDEVVLKN